MVPFYPSPCVAKRARRAGATPGGRKRDSFSSVATSGDLLDQRTGDVGQFAVGDHEQRFHVGRSRRLAIIIVSSAAMSVIGRTPRIITAAPHCLTNPTARPVKSANFDVRQMGRGGSNQPLPLLGGEQRLFFHVDADAHDQPIESRLARSMTFRCPSVIGSNEPG